ncbi:regulator of telomere elongation helicase 1 homolog isoform X3 [Vigna radiata var. radiata]|uniref:Regulator of telomere elongation helicase 1 homolog isoform X3 n=1 Tax=Vigna radiata var. radiata TaxID=3916 RepID=A0A3Q0FE87_VIGRR|nr:regulator of telomere elongation helicase 1 homolog isoform X3 [Vigna radiata var. radiata]
MQKVTKTRSSLVQLLLSKKWYNQQASRVVNQVVGHVIRHCHDYGAIILCDESQVSTQLPQLLLPHVSPMTMRFVPFALAMRKALPSDVDIRNNKYED